jgi:hypothetical protein
MTGYVVSRIALMVTAALGSAVALGVGLDDLPKRKPGLWEMSTASSENKGAPATSKVCIDATTDRELMNFGLGVTNQLCSKREIKVTGGVASIDMVCTVGNSQTTSHSTITYTGNNAYRAEVRAHFEPPFLGKTDSTTTQQAKWTGACPPDMKPGDLVTGNGVKINLRDLAAGKK